jgi:hypothetical protein
MSRAKRTSKRQLRHDLVFARDDIEALELRLLIRDNYIIALEQILRLRDELIAILRTGSQT